MTVEDPPMIQVRRSTLVRIGIAVAVLVALGVGFGIGYAVHSPTTAPANKNTYALKEGRISGKGTYIHFFENNTTTTQAHKTVLPGNATTTTPPTTSTTIPPTASTPTVATAVVPNAVIPGGSGPGIAALLRAGFTYWIAYRPVLGCPNSGMVLSQTPLAGSTAPVGSTVVLTVEKC